MSKLFDSLRRPGRWTPNGAAASVGHRFVSAVAERAAPRPAPVPVADAPAPGPPRAEVRTVSLRLDAEATLPFDSVDTSAGEQYRIIRTRIARALREPALVLVSSAAPGDGKTTTAINLAGIFALRNASNILLIDGDLVRGAVAPKLGLPNTPGLIDVLQGSCALEDALVRARQIPNLYILPAGQTALKRTELLDSPRWKKLCEAFRRQFSHTILDAPPIAALADYELLQAAADGIVVVVRPDRTKRNVCLASLQNVPREKLAGVILNDADPGAMPASYGFRNGYYNRHDGGARR